MSMATLEREILAEAQSILVNPKLKKKDILEWSTGDVEAADGEVVINCPVIGVFVCIKKTLDKRKAKA